MSDEQSTESEDLSWADSTDYDRMTDPEPVEDEAGQDPDPKPVVEKHPEETPPRPARPNRAAHKSSTQIAHEVGAGLWGKDGWEDRVEAAGFTRSTVEMLVAKGVGQPKRT